MMRAAMAQLVEHILGKDEVPSSNLGSSSKTKGTPNRGCPFWFHLALFKFRAMKLASLTVMSLRHRKRYDTIANLLQLAYQAIITMRSIS